MLDDQIVSTPSSTVALSLDVLVEVVLRVETKVTDAAAEVEFLIGEPLHDTFVRARVLVL